MKKQTKLQIEEPKKSLTFINAGSAFKIKVSKNDQLMIFLGRNLVLTLPKRFIESVYANSEKESA